MGGFSRPTQKQKKKNELSKFSSESEVHGMDRFTEDMKLWLFDVAHGNLDDEKILKGFIKYYVLHGQAIGNVQDDITFHTMYGIQGSERQLWTYKEFLWILCNRY